MPEAINLTGLIPCQSCRHASQIPPPASVTCHSGRGRMFRDAASSLEGKVVIALPHCNRELNFIRTRFVSSYLLINNRRTFFRNRIVCFFPVLAFFDEAYGHFDNRLDVPRSDLLYSPCEF